MDSWKRKFFLLAFRVFDQVILCLAFLLAASVESATIQSLTFDQFLEMRLMVGNFILFLGLLVIWHSIFTGFRLYHSRLCLLIVWNQRCQISIFDLLSAPGQTRFTPR